MRGGKRGVKLRGAGDYPDLRESPTLTPSTLPSTHIVLGARDGVEGGKAIIIRRSKISIHLPGVGDGHFEDLSGRAGEGGHAGGWGVEKKTRARPAACCLRLPPSCLLLSPSSLLPTFLLLSAFLPSLSHPSPSYPPSCLYAILLAFLPATPPHPPPLMCPPPHTPLPYPT